MCAQVDKRDFDRGLELVQAGDENGLRQFLEQNPDASEARDATGVSLVMHSVYRGRRDLGELIASKKKTLDRFEAAALGQIDQLRSCCGDRDAVNSVSADGFTALHFACFFRQPDAARVLIENGAAVDVAAANPTQVMPLHSAASARNLEAARLLLEHGAPVNARQQAGWVPLHSAAQNGDRAMVELLLAHGAKPELTNEQGKTAAAVAREKKHLEVADLLCPS
jgi:ankyrin repeat protein